MKITSDKIKAILTLMGHSNIKRTTKRKNEELTYREFISNTAEITVVTNTDDTCITAITINPLSSTLANLPVLQRVSIEGLTAELSRINALNLLTYLQDYKAIYNIPVVDHVLEFSVNYLIIYNTTPPIVLTTHYQEAIPLSDFLVSKENYSVANVDYEGNVQGSFVIPAGAYVCHYNPEYMQIITLTNDLTKGACTFNPESDTYTFNKNIASTLSVDLIDRTDHELSFLKTARKYDIVATCN